MPLLPLLALLLSVAPAGTSAVVAVKHRTGLVVLADRRVVAVGGALSSDGGDLIVPVASAPGGPVIGATAPVVAQFLRGPLAARLRGENADGAYADLPARPRTAAAARVLQLALGRGNDGVSWEVLCGGVDGGCAHLYLRTATGAVLEVARHAAIGTGAARAAAYLDAEADAADNGGVLEDAAAAERVARAALRVALRRDLEAVPPQVVRLGGG